MVSRAKLSVPRSKLRAVVTEMLPYELPVAFDNLAFFAFLQSVQLRWDDRYYYFRNEHQGVLTALRIIFGKGAAIDLDSNEYRVMKPFKSGSIPWQYAIRTRSGRDRVLSIPHPAAQLAIAELYASQSSLILHHASRGNFSLRAPSTVARYTTVRDSILLSGQMAGGDDAGVEAYDREARYLRSFFVYKKVSAIHQFYDSREYHDAEKTYQFLMRVDLTRCFDSIYTHSIAWAVHERESVKQDVDGHAGTFANEFDRVMRWANDNETNGIIIGPEVSRVFAELILQGIDRAVENRLHRVGLVNGKHYEVLRYVDDYFIFTSTAEDRGRIATVLEEELRPFRMSFNAAKTEEMEAPFVSPMTVAKASIARLIDDCVSGADLTKPADPERLRRILVDGVKRTLLQTGLAMSDVSNFASAVIERNLEELINRFRDGLSPSEGANAKVTTAASVDLGEQSLMAISVACFATQAYLLGVTPLVTVTFKYSRTASLLLRSFEELGANERSLASLREVVSAETRRLLHQLRRRGGIEWLWLLETMSDLPAPFQLSAGEYLELIEGEPDTSKPMGSLALMSLLRAVGTQLSLRNVKAQLERLALARVEELAGKGRPSAECSILALNLVTSPFVEPKTKSSVARMFNPNATKAGISDLESSHPFWFARPIGESLYEELRVKRVHEVY